MPIKIGGGKKLQEYDEKNGRYGNGNLFEFKTAEDGIQYQLLTGKEPPMPVFSPNNDNEEYARWWVDNVFHKWLEYKSFFDPRKVKDYLLVCKEKDDKSYFFETFGCFQTDWKEVYNLIASQSDFQKAKFDRISVHGVKVMIEVNIPDKGTGKARKAYAIWMVDDERKAKFITLKPGK